jgi:glycosyltransferase involved in cell wall biosynthesis
MTLLTNERPIRTLFISSAGRIGGAERSLFELLCVLPKDRVEIHACLPPDSHLAHWCDAAGLTVHPAPMRRFRRTLHPFLLAGQIRALYQGARQIAELVRREKIEVLHANTDSSALFAWEVARETKRPFIWHCRDLRPLGPMARILAFSAARVAAISAAVEEHLKAQGVPQKRLLKILNGVDLTRFHNEAKRAEIRAGVRRYLGLAPDAPVVISIGFLSPWKRHELFLEALTLARRTRPDLVGILVGGDLFGENAGYLDFLETRIEASGLADNGFLFLEHREDVPDLLAAADLFFSAAENEPFGRVLAEAGASGLPVICTDSGAKREIVVHEQTGLLLPADAPTLAAALVRLAGDPETAQRLGANGRVRVAAHFDIRRTAAELTALIETIVGERRRADVKRGSL